MPEKPCLEVRLDGNSDSVQYADGAYSETVTDCVELTMENNEFLNEFLEHKLDVCNIEQQRDSLLIPDSLDLHIRQCLT